MTNSDNRRWGLFGPLAVVLWVVGIFLLNKNGPADHATGSDILYRVVSSRIESAIRL